MAEAVHYFQHEGAWKIALNTEESNTRAHKLYEWFGFYLTCPHGFALGQAMPSVPPLSWPTAAKLTRARV
jgi:hypothetical protein